MIAERIEYFNKKREELSKMANELDIARAQYKAEMKAEFGITDGEPADVLSLIMAIHAVNTKQ